MLRHSSVLSLVVTVVFAGWPTAGQTTHAFEIIEIPLLNVDFEQVGQGATETGFVSFADAQSQAAPQFRNYASPEGILTVGTSGQQGFFNRGGLADSGPFTYAELYNDFVYHNGGGTISFTIAGIQPNQDYEITWYSFDRHTSIQSTTQFLPTPLSTTTGAVGNIVYNYNGVGDDPTTNDQYSFTGIWRSSTNILSIDADIISGSFNRVNGFELSRLVLVPEPGSLGLLTGGIAVALAHRRRRRHVPPLNG